MTKCKPKKSGYFEVSGPIIASYLLFFSFQEIDEARVTNCKGRPSSVKASQLTQEKMLCSQPKVTYSVPKKKTKTYIK